MRSIADSFLVRPGHGSDVDVLRMRFGCDPALDATQLWMRVALRARGASRLRRILTPCLTSRLRASCAVALAILCGVSSRVAVPLQYESSHTRLLAITEEFEFHPGLPGWNFFYPKCGMGDARAKCSVGRPLGRKSFAGRIMLGAFAWTPPDRSGLEFGIALGEAASLAALPPGQAVLCLGCLGYLGSAAFASGRHARRNRYTTKRN